MTLVEICEPLFQHVCRINRSARKGVCPDMSQVRSELVHVMNDVRSRCAAAGLSDQFTKVEPVLLGFADSMIQHSKLTWASQWKPMAPERGGAMMDEQFFDMLDENLKDRSDAATERLCVYYTCLGLGFTGWYAGQPEELRKKMRELASRLGSRLDTDRSARLCQDSYESVDRRNLYEPPTRLMTRTAIVLIGVTLSVLAANIGLFKDKRDQMKSSIQALLEKDSALAASGVPGASPAPPAPAAPPARPEANP